MPQKKIQLRVVKVPLSKDERPKDRNQNFPRMPRMYLELLENKAKIKQDLINKEHNPELDNYISDYNTCDNISDDYRQESKKSNCDAVYDRQESKNNSDTFEDRLEMLMNDSDNDSDIFKSRGEENQNDTHSNISDKYNDYERSNEDGDNQRDRDVYDSYCVDRDYEEEKHNDGKIINEVVNDTDNGSEDLQNHLNKILNDTDSDVSSYEYNRRGGGGNKYSRKRTHNIMGESLNVPTLAEIEEKGGYNRKKAMRDINNITMSEQEEEDAKREMIFKFEMLRKSWPGSAIPEFTIHSDFSSMKKSYDMTVKRLSLDSSVDYYKKWLTACFMATEFILGNFLGLDMAGFTQQQMVSINQYERLLIEMGEKSYSPTGSKWPVEARLLFMVIGNAAIFVGIKMMQKKTGVSLMGMMNDLQTPKTQPSVRSSKRRMKPPNIDVDNLPDVDDDI